MNDPGGSGGWSYDVQLAVQVIVLAVFSGIVAWLQRWRQKHYTRRYIWRNLLIDVMTSALVGISVYISARHASWHPDWALGTSIVAGHYGARWIGVLAHEYNINVEEPAEDERRRLEKQEDGTE